MITIQAEIAKELINNNDATIQGILLSVIVISWVVIGVLWKAKLADEKYIRTQDKATVELCLTLTTNVKESSNVGSKNNDAILKVLSICSEMLSHIKMKNT